MITKERLEEIREKDGRVFILIDSKPMSEKLNNLCLQIGYVDNKEHFVLFDVYDRMISITNEDLFETKEDAEEYLKYGNVKKTVELVMADWDDVKNTTHGYCGSFWEENILYELIIEGGEVYIRTTDYYYPELENQFNREDYKFKKEFNRENYNEARDLFVKLFKGEE